MNKVKVINQNIQELDGIRYYADKKGRPYYRRTFRVDGKITTRSLHRMVYEKYKGDIPDGFHVHHKDGDWRNNEPNNLALMEGHHHLSNHMKQPERRAQIEKMQKMGVEAAKEWHGSEEGLKWHSEMSKKAWAKREPIEKECAACHSVYTTLDRKQSARFCSNNCKMNARRRRLRGLPEDAPRAMLRKRK